MPDIEQTAARWIVVPECEVNVTVNNGKPNRIGFNTSTQALLAVLTSQGIPARAANESNTAPDGDEKRPVRVIARESNGVSLAYAVEWNEYFREWEFLRADRLRESEADRILLGTCIEGIRIEFDSPGFEGSPVLAIANVKGINAPKTNVARSGIEATAERDAMLRTLYEMYVDHVTREVTELHTKRAFSLTWATGEARFLLEPLRSVVRLGAHERTRSVAVNEALLEDSLKNVPALLVESTNRRSTVSANALCATQGVLDDRVRSFSFSRAADSGGGHLGFACAAHSSLGFIWL